MSIVSRLRRIEKLTPVEPVVVERPSWRERVQKVLELTNALLDELNAERLFITNGPKPGAIVVTPAWTHPDRYHALLLCFALNRGLAQLRADGHPTPTTLDDLRELLAATRREALSILAGSCNTARTHVDAAIPTR